MARTITSQAATSAYIVAVAALALLLSVLAFHDRGLERGSTLLVFVGLVALKALSGDDVPPEGRVSISISSILLLAAVALLGPAGAALIGAALGAVQNRGHVPARARIFNAAQTAIHGVLGGYAYLLAGGAGDVDHVTGAWPILRDIGFPTLVADLVQMTVNLVLVAGVVRVSQLTPMRVQIAAMLRSTGASYVGYGVIAFLMVVLWEPAGLGPAAAVLVLAPLLVAQWAYRQHAEELEGQHRALQVLVAAVEAKAPHLSGHSARVAELSALMAEHLGLGPQQVADARVAGMLHDLGQTSLPTSLVRASDAHGSREFRTYPARGADLLRGLSFLAGALPAIETHHDALEPAVPGSLPARIVGLADAYDLLTHVGTPDGALLTSDEAVADLRSREHVAAELVRALSAALARRTAGTAR